MKRRCCRAVETRLTRVRKIVGSPEGDEVQPKYWQVNLKSLETERELSSYNELKGIVSCGRRFSAGKDSRGRGTVCLPRK